MSEKAGRKDASVIKNQQILEPEKAGKVTKSTISEGSRFALQMQHAGGGTVGQSFLCYQFWR
jgi:hypothetical protein